MTHRQAVLAMIAVTLMWSIAGVVTRQLQSAESFEITFWRSAFNALALVVLLVWLRGATALWERLRRGGPALWLSGLCWSVMFTAFMLAITLTTIANVLVTMALAPLFTALLARVALRRPLPRRTWVAVALAGAGIVWMYGWQFAGGQAQLLLGTAVALAVPVAAAVNWTLLQALEQRAQGGGQSAEAGRGLQGRPFGLLDTHPADAQPVDLRPIDEAGPPATAGATAATVVMATTPDAPGPARAPPSAASPSLSTQASAARGPDMLPAVLIGALISAAVTLPLAWPLAATPQDLGWLALLGVVQLAIPCLLVVAVARVLPAPELALLSLLEVIFGVLWAWLGAGEVPGASVLAGGALVLAALAGNEALALWQARRRPRER